MGQFAFLAGAQTDLAPATEAMGKHQAACANAKDRSLAARGALVDLLGALDDLSLDAATARAFLDSSAMMLSITAAPDATREQVAVEANSSAAKVTAGIADAGVTKAAARSSATAIR